jgi:prepilin signal peptidase PulO-like enzyme (type II secretory pathway)
MRIRKGVKPVNVFQDIRDTAVPLLNEPITLLVLIGFVLWAGIFDIKTLKITNRFNKIYLVTGLALMALHFAEKSWGLPELMPSLAFGWTNIWGMLAGFGFLFIPAFFKNHPMGGDIKMTAVLGFWIGFEPLLYVLFIGALLNAVYWMGAFSIWKEYGSKTLMPFAPFFALGVLVVYGIGYFA